MADEGKPYTTADHERDASLHPEQHRAVGAGGVRYDTNGGVTLATTVYDCRCGRGYVIDLAKQRIVQSGPLGNDMEQPARIQAMPTTTSLADRSPDESAACVDPTTKLSHAEFRRIVGLAHDVEDEAVTRRMKQGVLDALREYERLVGGVRSARDLMLTDAETRLAAIAVEHLAASPDLPPTSKDGASWLAQKLRAIVAFSHCASGVAR